jgi:tubulin alpha
MNEVRKGKYRELIASDQLISGKEDGANNFARGSYTEGRGLIKPILESIRKLISTCTNFKGFIIFNGVDGGTGSGLAACLLEELPNEYKKSNNTTFSVYASPKIGRSVVEPYNSLFLTAALNEYSTMPIVIENEALGDICEYNLGIKFPSFNDMNLIIAHIVSSFFASMSPSYLSLITL